MLKALNAAILCLWVLPVVTFATAALVVVLVYSPGEPARAATAALLDVARHYQGTASPNLFVERVCQRLGTPARHGGPATVPSLPGPCHEKAVTPNQIAASLEPQFWRLYAVLVGFNTFFYSLIQLPNNRTGWPARRRRADA